MLLLGVELNADIMDTLKRLSVVSTIATVAAVIGMELIALRDKQHVDFDTLAMVVPRSIFLWVVFSFMLRERSALVGIYLGLLSPLLGGIIMVHPIALLIVFKNLVICLIVGAITGALISLASREELYS